MKKQRKRDTKSFRKEIKKKQLTQKSKIEFGVNPLFPIIDELKTMNTQNFLNKESLKSIRDLRYIISTDNIPYEIKGKVKELIEKKPPRMGQCLWYSKFISSQIEGVNQVFGLFNLDNYNEIGHIFPSNEVIHFNGTTVIKDEKNQVWGIHSWNEYNGVYFDCLKDGIYDKLNEPKTFIKYKILKSTKFNSKNHLKDYMNSKYEIISQSLELLS